MRNNKFARTAFALSAALALAACGGAEEDAEYEVGAEDLSGGKMITRDPEDPAVPVDIPEVEMTNASEEEIAGAGAEEAVAEEEAAMEAAD